MIWIDVFTVEDFIKYFSSKFTFKINKLHRVWPDSRNRLLYFIDFLRSEGYAFSDEWSTEDLDEKWNNDIAEEYISMSLTAFSSILSLRTINALLKVKIDTIEELLQRYEFISAEKIQWLWKKWYSEIATLIKYIRTKKDTTLELTKNEDIFSLVNDDRLVWILNYNLVSTVSQLWSYVKWNLDWLDLRYLKEEDITTLTEIYNSVINTDNKGSTIADLFLNQFSEVDKQIIAERILWELNLEQIWKKLHLTRERVRQKQKELENRIADLWKSIIEKNPELHSNILKVIADYKYVLLPKQTYLFNFLWFKNEDFRLLFLALKWLSGIKGEYIEKNRIYVLCSDETSLDWSILRDIYSFYMKKLQRNNEDISLEDIFYEYLLDDNWSEKQDNMPKVKSKRNKSTEISYKRRGEWEIYELNLKYHETRIITT